MSHFFRRSKKARGSYHSGKVFFPYPHSDGINQRGIRDLWRQIATRVDYPSVGFDENDDLKDGGHEAMQVLADGYKVGAKRVAGVTQKKKAAQFDSIQKGAEDVDMNDPTALAAFVERVKKSGAAV